MERHEGVLSSSNCHGNELTFVERKQKNGEKLAVACPKIISFYNKYMGGVDSTDHSGLYEFDRKSTKWWKKVFYKLLMITAVNAFIIYNEVRRKKTLFLEFLVALAESLIQQGKSKAEVKRRQRLDDHERDHVGDYLPIVEQKRRRCTRCSQRKIEKQIRTVCRTCSVPLCNNFFTVFHM